METQQLLKALAEVDRRLAQDNDLNSQYLREELSNDALYLWKKHRYSFPPQEQDAILQAAGVALEDCPL